jgi:hypothetical protein
MKAFENITWPEGAIYNINPEKGAKIKGEADVEILSKEMQELQHFQRLSSSKAFDQIGNLS